VNGVVAVDDENEVAKLRNRDAVPDTVSGTTVQRLLKANCPGGVFASALGKPQGAARQFSLPLRSSHAVSSDEYVLAPAHSS
jgi:hypothetical protein